MDYKEGAGKWIEGTKWGHRLEEQIDETDWRDRLEGEITYKEGSDGPQIGRTDWIHRNKVQIVLYG
jgi:hypothetical protein